MSHYEKLKINPMRIFVFVFLFYFKTSQANNIDEVFRERKGNQIIYRLSINYKSVHFTDKTVQAMAINDTLPAPTLYFREGDRAVIHVTNNMDVESSIHWHGILLPNIQDGVPYLTTPPVLPGQTYTYRFRLKQSGTYWYHSHTGLQEQRGLYGAIVIEPRQKKHKYDHNLVFVLSDWTDENPKEVMRALKRGSEWYSIKKETTQSFLQVIANKALLSQLKMWKSRMPGMDISDVYYPAFLLNGKREQKYSDFKAGDKIRLRLINASASTYFWLTFGGKNPLLISADGLDVQPVPAQNILHAIGETYDFLITVPKNRSIQFRATAQDGSGMAVAHIGQGRVLKAPLFPKPDLFQQMKEMAKMHSGGHERHKVHFKQHNTHTEHHKINLHKQTEMKNRHKGMAEYNKTHIQEERTVASKSRLSALNGKTVSHKTNENKQENHRHHKNQGKTNIYPSGLKTSVLVEEKKPKNSNRIGIKSNQKYHNYSEHRHSNHHHSLQHKSTNGKAKTKRSTHKSPKGIIITTKQNPTLKEKKHKASANKVKTHEQHSLSKKELNVFSYQKLRSLKAKTPSSSLREIQLDLNGNMWRYVWSMNNKTLSESDKIQIKKGERLRIILNNKTMMHHPMHLHGHFFRVLNQQKEYSPLKHTVDIPPMEKLVIEFDPQGKGDWFFHCHVLYHMMGGMSRIFSNRTARDKLLQKYPAKTIINEDNHWYQWGAFHVMSHRADGEAVFSNTRNQILMNATFSWFGHKYQEYKNYEVSLSYERFTSDFFRVYTEMEMENKKEGVLGNIKNADIVVKLGIRYLLPYFVEWDTSLDHKARWEIELGYELHLLPRILLLAEWSAKVDSGFITKKEKWNWDQEWSVDIEYILSKSFSLRGGYSNHFGWGAGLSIRY